MNLETIRQKLRQHRNENDLRLQEISLDIGVSVGTLSKFLSDKTNPNERTRYKIEKYLKENGG